MVVKTKSVYDRPEAGDGFRLLIMRKWPRGVARESIDEWRKDLGPSPELLGDWRNQRIDWDEFNNRYQQEMVGNQEAIEWLKAKAARDTVTLLCGCKDEQRCHRSILKQLI